jgi:hypothetical protein
MDDRRGFSAEFMRTQVLGLSPATWDGQDDSLLEDPVPKYPLVKTMVYDTTQVNEEGQEIYIYEGKFTPNPGPSSSPRNVFKPIAVVHKPPTKESPDLELLIVGAEWTVGAYHRHRVLTAILKERDRCSDPKIVVVPTEDWRIIDSECADVFEPAVRVEDKHRGRIYGLLLYDTFSTKKVQVF